MGKKMFGNKRTGPAPREDFTMVFRDQDDKAVEHDFRAVVRMDAAGLKRALKTMQDDPQEGLTVLFEVVAGQLDDTDGVPEAWKPVPHAIRPWPADSHTPVNPPAVYEPVPDGTEAPADAVFRVPVGAEAGKWLPLAHSEEFTTHVAGSSRRRWVDLIDNNDDVAIELDDLKELFQWLITLAAERPTRPLS
jgi:hypothetical protein